jgi:hypothetical protein
MTKTAIRLTAIAWLAGLAIAGNANAKYLCNEPPSSRDARACDAAKEGPEALRRFIQRMRVVEFLQFEDYVNKETVLAWEAKEANERQQASK